MSKVIEAVYENGVFLPLEPVVLPEGEHVQVTVPDLNAVQQRRLAALATFDAACADLSEKVRAVPTLRPVAPIVYHR